MSRKKLGLDDAYAVETPEDNRQLYRDWADTYESEFTIPRGYVYPDRIADIYTDLAGPGDAPILDVGAGTGLVGAALVAASPNVVDAIDISEEMLSVSQSKGIYRNLLQADLTGPLNIDDGIYGAVVSAGTFTHGHVGPGAFAELLRISRAGALFVIGINARVFDEYGFGSSLASLCADGKLGELTFRHMKYYEKADDEHAGDVGLTACFRKM